ncbi:Arabinogalactan peptide-like protein [Quillaja saponaria]|uniref:Arabinogalactan peptide-like protein n=1 Tax=Quillaja saponaria TaxID=32244 RepID=A0AAD7P7H5_QUISA|nr:Arabinogalactan peptide-like protein [Quillaja saponaria]
MAVCRFSFGVVAVVAALVFVLVMPAAVQAQSPAPAPAPTSGRTSVDQGVAYLLMLVALVLTYLIHSADISSGY